MDILYGILHKIINMSITGTIAILAVLVIRMLLSRAPKKYSYALWGIVLFRLLCPVSLPSVFSVLNLAHVEVKEGGEVAYISENISLGQGNPDLSAEQKFPMQQRPVKERESSLKAKEEEAFGIKSVEDETGALVKVEEKQNSFLFLGMQSSFWFAVWLIGAGILAGSRLLSGMRLSRQVSCSIQIQGNIYLADYIASPFVLGMLHPKIYLPSCIEEKEQEYIILHEQCHIARKDYFIKILAFLAVCIHWFNPLVWMAFFLAGKDMEMSCDEEVMRKMDRDIRAEYAESLLRFTVGKRKIPGMLLAFGEGDVKKRIKNIMDYKKPTAVVSVIGIVGCLLGGICLITNPKPEKVMQDLAQLGNGSSFFADGFHSGSEGDSGLSSESQEREQMEEAAEAAIKDAIIEHNGTFYSGEYSYDVACGSFTKLGEESSEDAKGRQKITYYGWALYNEYKFQENGLKEVGGSHIPAALTFVIEEGEYLLEEYWEPGDGSYLEQDIRGKFPGHIVKDGLDSQKFIVKQMQDCYEQAVAYGKLDTAPVIEQLIDSICMDGESESSDPQDYIDAHLEEYRELIYYGGYTVRYCMNRFEQGGETGLEGHIMARVCEEITGAVAEIPIKAKLSETGQQWYDGLKGYVSKILEKFVETEGIPTHIEFGIPVSLPQNKNWIQNLTVQKSDEKYLQLQYYDGILKGQCTMWIVKDGEIDLPEIAFEEAMDETWEGHTIAERLVEVKVQHAEGWTLASWEYESYNFAILGEVSSQHSDTISIPKTSLGLIGNLP